MILFNNKRYLSDEVSLLYHEEKESIPRFAYFWPPFEELVTMISPVESNCSQNDYGQLDSICLENENASFYTDIIGGDDMLSHELIRNYQLFSKYKGHSLEAFESILKTSKRHILADIAKINDTLSLYQLPLLLWTGSWFIRQTLLKRTC